MQGFKVDSSVFPESDKVKEPGSLSRRGSGCSKSTNASGECQTVHRPRASPLPKVLSVLLALGTWQATVVRRLV